MLGCLVIVPFILAWHSRTFLRYNLGYYLEVISAIGSLMVVTLLIFTNGFTLEKINQPTTYLIFPPIIWLSFRFGYKTIALANFLLSFTAIFGTFHGLGPFARANVSMGLLHLQTFMAVVTSSALLMTAVVRERNNLEQKKDEFISLASHELKTPLTVLSGFNQLLQKEFAKKKQTTIIKKYLYHTDNQIRRLTKLVKDLLDTSKFELGTYEFKKEKFLLQQLIEETVTNIQTLNSKHQIVLSGQANEYILADRDGISQVLENLISNAIKYSPGKTKIVVKVISQGRKVVISVRDYGMGIAPNYKDIIFNRFYRVTSETTKNISGLGLGLYLCANIIKSHNGKIWFKSKPKRGTTFFCYPSRKQIVR